MKGMDRLLEDGKWITTAYPVGSAFVDRLKSKLYPDRFNGIQFGKQCKDFR